MSETIRKEVVSFNLTYLCSSLCLGLSAFCSLWLFFSFWVILFLILSTWLVSSFLLSVRCTSFNLLTYLLGPLFSLHAFVLVTLVEVRVLQEADEAGSDGLLRPVLPWALLHGVSPHLRSGSWYPHAPRWLALRSLRHLPQTQNACHTWGNSQASSNESGAKDHLIIFSYIILWSILFVRMCHERERLHFNAFRCSRIILFHKWHQQWTYRCM